jgi:ubiquinone/menaquinone biosynthesis C-methylase UbiE
VPTQEEIYEQHAAEYEALVSHEDYRANILRAIREIAPPEGRDVLDLGAGTGRLAGLLAPYVRTMLAFDLSVHMLGLARDKLRRLRPKRWLAAAADHRLLPLPARAADLIVSGWSVSYLAVWHPDRWRLEAEAWLREARRVLRKGGLIILFESLGTGNESPQRLAHLENFYGWLDEKGFRNKWIRTDYRFESAERAGEVAGFFFGDEMRERIRRDGLSVLPECTGVWWLSPG